MKDLYEELEVPRTASKKDITRAYRKAARRKHPDAGGDEKAFHALVRAYQVLNDDARRARYDATGDAEEKEPDNAIADVLNLCSQCLSHVINTLMNEGQKPHQHDLVALIRNLVTNQLAEARTALKRLADAEANLKTIQGRFIALEGEENLMERIVVSHFREIGEGRKRQQAIEDRAVRTLAFLKGFKFKADKRAGAYATATTTSGMFFTGI